MTDLDDAAHWLAALDPGERGALLRSVADALDDDVDALVPLADTETSLGTARLTGEVARTSGQLRLFAEVLAEGSCLRATIDHADPPRPDLRAVMEPLGPVAVFAASNFPFAFGVAGGDTASALAAGCPVVAKAHPGHPELSERIAVLVRRAVAGHGAPPAVFGTVSGFDKGRELVLDPAIRAVGFTGSLAGGRALFDLAAGRPDPIPFFGELGSLNPVVVTRAAALARGPQIAAGLVASYTLGVGQFCTKPGLVLIPEGCGLEAAVVAALPTAHSGRMLTSGISQGFRDGAARLADAVEVLAGVVEDSPVVRPLLLAADVDFLLGDPDLATAEVFGPVCLLVRYRDGELGRALEVLPGALTASLHAEAGEAGDLGPVVSALRARAGRLVFNGWPTGVAVSWAQHHGGPWPATTASAHTSVGAGAILRWLRPVCYQDYPDELLPPALREGNPLGIPRRVDGTWIM
ncbi:aldehyde dehydrogenase (NADP(+)) [Actinokineospora sp. 24-640]